MKDIDVKIKEDRPKIQDCYSLSVGVNPFKRKCGIIRFETFKELIDKLEGAKKPIPASKSNKFMNNWISGDLVKPKNNYMYFKQDNFIVNGRLVILDIDDGLSIEQAISILSIEKLNYYLYNSTNNGKFGKEKYRIIIPLNESITDFKRLTTLYKSMNEMFNGKLDKSCLHVCRIYYKPENWTPHIDNKTPITVSLWNIDKNDLDVDATIERFKDMIPIEIPKTAIRTGETLNPLNKFQLAKNGVQISEDSRDSLSNILVNSFDYMYSKSRRNKLVRLAVNLLHAGNSLDGVVYYMNKSNYFEKHTDRHPKQFLDIAFDIFQNEGSSIWHTVTKKYKEDIDMKVKSHKEIFNKSIHLEEGKISNLKEFKDNDIFPNGQVSLLSSPTNSGKTFFVLNDYKDRLPENECVVLIVPFVNLRDELENYGAYIYRSQETFNYQEAKKAKAIVVVYNSGVDAILSMCGSNCHVFIDEAHNFYSSFSYRFFALNELFHFNITNKENIKKVVLMSGTYNSSYYKNDFIDNKIEVTSNRESKNIQIIDTKDTYGVLLKNIENSKGSKQIIFINHKIKGSLIKDKLKEINISSMLYNADTKESKEVLYLTKNNKIPNNVDIVIMTQSGVEGISILDEVKNIHILGFLGTDEIEQLSNRPRRNSADVFMYIDLLPSYDSLTKDINLETKEETRLEEMTDYMLYGINNNQIPHSKEDERRNVHITRDLSNGIFYKTPLLMASYKYQDDLNIEKGNLNIMYFGELLKVKYRFNVSFIRETSKASKSLNFTREEKIKYDLNRFNKEESKDIELVKRLIKQGKLTNEDVYKTIDICPTNKDPFKMILDTHLYKNNKIENDFIKSKYVIGELYTNEQIKIKFKEYVDYKNEYNIESRKEKFSINNYKRLVKYLFKTEIKRVWNKDRTKLNTLLYIENII